MLPESGVQATQDVGQVRNKGQAMPTAAVLVLRGEIVKRRYTHGVPLLNPLGMDAKVVKVGRLPSRKGSCCPSNPGTP